MCGWVANENKEVELRKASVQYQDTIVVKAFVVEHVMDKCKF